MPVQSNGSSEEDGFVSVRSNESTLLGACCPLSPRFTGYDTVADVRDLLVPLASSTFNDGTADVANLLNARLVVSPVRVASRSKFVDSHSAVSREVQPDSGSARTYDSCLTSKQAKDLKNSWSLRLTVPEPFNITLAPPKDNASTKSSFKAKFRERLVQEASEKKRADDVECRRQFRANPVPPETFLPVYERMSVNEARRRADRKEKSRERLYAVQQPFDFFFREEVKRHFRRATSTPNLSAESEMAENPKPRKNLRRSSPSFTGSRKESARGNLPRSPSYSTVNHVSSAPVAALTTPRASLKPTTASSRRRPATVARMCAPTPLEPQRPPPECLRPSSILNPPDFKTIHQKLAEQTKRNQRQRSRATTTSCEPFSLHTTGIQSHKERIAEDIRRDEETLPETRWPFQAPRSPVRPVSASPSVRFVSSPPKLNWSAKLRVEKSKQSVQKGFDGSEGFSTTKRGEWKSNLRRTLSAKMAFEYNSETIEEKNVRRRSDLKLQLMEYQRELSKILKRVGRRPLLMEQQVEFAARKQAEKLFVEKLRKQGLTEEFVLHKSRRCVQQSVAASTAGTPRTQSKTSSTKYSPSSSSSAPPSSRKASSSSNESRKVSLSEGTASGRSRRSSTPATNHSSEEEEASMKSAESGSEGSEKRMV